MLLLAEQTVDCSVLYSILLLWFTHAVSLSADHPLQPKQGRPGAEGSDVFELFITHLIYLGCKIAVQ